MQEQIVTDAAMRHGGDVNPCRRVISLGPLHRQQRRLPHLRTHSADIQVSDDVRPEFVRYAYAWGFALTATKRALLPTVLVPPSIPQMLLVGGSTSACSASLMATSYIRLFDHFRCINETDGLLLSAPTNTTLTNAYFCNRYKINAAGTQVELCTTLPAAVLFAAPPSANAPQYTFAPYVARWHCPASYSWSLLMYVKVFRLTRMIKTLLCPVLQAQFVANFQTGSFPDCPDRVIGLGDLDSAPSNVKSVGTFNVIGNTQLPQCPPAAATD